MNLNEELFTCSKEDFIAKLSENALGPNDSQALNFNVEVLLCPISEKSKGGVYLTIDDAEHIQQRTPIGRVMSRGSSVGEKEALRDLKNLAVGDYVSFNYFAAGQHTKLPYIDIQTKIFADDMIRKVLSQKAAFLQSKRV